MVKRMARTSKRTDPHRPGAIIPAHYEYVFSFNLSSTMDGWPVPSFRVNCQLDRRVEFKDADGKLVIQNGEHDADGGCCVVGLRQIRGERFALEGGPGKCTVCGACYVYGDAWRHTLTGEVIFLGHDCADKYSLLADRSEAELAATRAKNATAAAILAEKTKEERAAFLAAHPGLEAALGRDHYILVDLGAKLRQYRTLSDKQVALALKLAHELDHPRAAEVMVPAPLGKQTFRGTVVSTKILEGTYGSSLKMTVKVTTPAGVWLAWGTAPAALVSDTCNHGGLKGTEVEVTATLKAGRDAHFAILGRPRGKVVKLGCDPEQCSECLRAKLGDEGYYRHQDIQHYRRREIEARQMGEFEMAVEAQRVADEIERTGRKPAEKVYYSP